MLPCLIMLVLVGLPLVFLELALGQFSACGPTKLFGRMAPIFGGWSFPGTIVLRQLSFGILAVVNVIVVVVFVEVVVVVV